MITYVKLYGPPLLESITALEKIALDTPEVCIMDSLIEQYYPPASPMTFGTAGGAEGHETHGGTWAQNYFQPISMDITIERCDTIISKSGETLGEYDFYFEWFKEPSMEQLRDLIKKIDETLKPLGVRYSLTTKK